MALAARKKGYCIAEFAGAQERCAASLFRKLCCQTVFVMDTVAAEDHSAFVLVLRFLKFGVFDHA